VGAGFDMPPGLTAIVGANGAGKTAILEAIGLAAFDFRPSRLATLMRDGTVDTVVKIEFTSSLDGRRYLVTRHLHRSRARRTGTLSSDVKMNSEVFDVELSTIFEQRAAEVEVFLAQHVGATGFTGPADVFAHVVGVPQGRLTADFLDPPRLRQERFDPILRTDEFKRAVDELLPLVHHFSGRRIAHESLAAELARYAERRPMAESELAGAEREAEEVARHRATAQSVVNRAREAARDHDRRAQVAEAAVAASNLAASQVHMMTEAVNAAAHRLSDAQEAFRVLDRNRADHDAFVSAQVTIGCLGDVGNQRDQLRERLVPLQQAENQAAFECRQAQDLLCEAEEALARMDSLAEAARGETDASDQLQALETERAVALAIAGRGDTDEAEVVEARHKVETEIATLDDAIAGLRCKQRRLQREWSGALALQPLVDELETRREVVQELRAERSVMAAVMEADGQAVALLAEAGACPFFDSECLNLAAIPDVSLVFRDRAAAHSNRVSQIDASDGEARAALAEAEDAARRMGVLSERREALDVAKRGLATFVATRDRLRPVEAAASREDAEMLEHEIGCVVVTMPDDVQTKVTVDAARRLARGLRSLVEARRADSEVDRIGREIVVAQQALASQAGARDAHRRCQVLASEHPIRRQAVDDAAVVLETSTRARARVDVDLEAIKPHVVELQDVQHMLRQARAGHERFLQHERLAGEIDTCARHLAGAEARVNTAAATARATQMEATRLCTEADPKSREAAHAARDVAIERAAELDTRVKVLNARMGERQNELDALSKAESRLAAERRRIARITELHARTEFMRGVLRDAGPLVTEALLADVSETADEIFGEVLGSRTGRLHWAADYDIVIDHGGYERRFAQLSGGEQMTAALAVRLALMRELLNVGIAFFDEPTQNLDDLRRANLAQQIQRVRGFQQLVVITHDDTFERVLDHVIHVRKVGSESTIDSK